MKKKASEQLKASTGLYESIFSLQLYQASVRPQIIHSYWWLLNWAEVHSKTHLHTHRSWPCQSLLWLPHQTIQASLVLSASPHLPAGLCRVISEPLLVKQMLVLTLIRIKQSSKSRFDQLASKSILYLGLIWNGIYIYSISSEETVCVSEL